jgi:hypothetical protein
MTKLEDQLFGQLMAEHGHRLRAVERPAPARRRVRRPVWLAAGAAAAVTATVMALGSAPASAAYSVTRHANGTVTVSVDRIRRGRRQAVLKCFAHVFSPRGVC